MNKRGIVSELPIIGVQASRFLNQKVTGLIMKYHVLLLSVVVFVTGCVSQPTTPTRPPVTWTRDAATADEKETAKAQVLKVLKDPDSARFGEIWALNGTNGHRTVCGYINARNSFGGYTGNKVFTTATGDALIEGSEPLNSLVPRMCEPRTVQ